jgi:biopolymer transport protein ExbD
MRFYTSRRKPLTINIVSLIDILTLLLIFFIVTTQFKKAEPKVRIKLPESTTAQKSEEKKEPVLLHATRDGRVFLGDQEIPVERLRFVLAQRRAEQPGAVFALKADTDVPLGFFVKVLDASKEAGVADMSLFTESPGTRP